jgi:hypothetical protein
MVKMEELRFRNSAFVETQDLQGFQLFIVEQGQPRGCDRKSQIIAQRRRTQATPTRHNLAKMIGLGSKHIVNAFNLWVVVFVALGTLSTAYGLAIIGSTVGQPNCKYFCDVILQMIH